MNQQVYLAIVAALLVAFLLTFAFYRYVVQPNTRTPRPTPRWRSW